MSRDTILSSDSPMHHSMTLLIPTILALCIHYIIQPPRICIRTSEYISRQNTVEEGSRELAVATRDQFREDTRRDGGKRVLVTAGLQDGGVEGGYDVRGL